MMFVLVLPPMSLRTDPSVVNPSMFLRRCMQARIQGPRVWKKIQSASFWQPTELIAVKSSSRRRGSLYQSVTNTSLPLRRKITENVWLCRKFEDPRVSDDGSRLTGLRPLDQASRLGSKARRREGGKVRRWPPKYCGLIFQHWFVFMKKINSMKSKEEKEKPKTYKYQNINGKYREKYHAQGLRPLDRRF